MLLSGFTPVASENFRIGRQMSVAIFVCVSAVWLALVEQSLQTTTMSLVSSSSSESTVFDDVTSVM